MHLHQFLTSPFDRNCPCACITLELRKALRVIWDTNSWGRRPVRVLSPRQGRPKPKRSQERALFRKFHENLNFRVPCKNLFLCSDFSKTHRQTQRIHSWIALGLRNLNKLVPCKTNTQILSCDHFSGRFAQKMLSHS